MADLINTQRLQPCLLDRLTDDSGGRVAETRDRRGFSIAQIRESVLRDLGWLLNTPRRYGAGELEEAPNVATSVVNFGVSDLCGVTLSAVSARALEREIAETIRRYEPRILPQTLGVSVRIDPDAYGHSGLGIEITGALWAQPAPEPLRLSTRLDLESGQYEWVDL